MAVCINNVPYNINEIMLTRELRPVLHGPPFSDVHNPRHATPLNFHLRLIPHKLMRHAHTGKGVLTFPSAELANLAVEYFTQPFRIGDRQIMFEPRSSKSASENLMEGLKLRPYRDPQEIIQLTDRLIDLRYVDNSSVKIKNVECMHECRDWVLSPEWEWRPGQCGLPGAGPCYTPEWPFLIRLEERTRELVIEKFDNKDHSTMMRMRYLSISCIDMDTSTLSFVIYLTYPPSYERADYSVNLPRIKLFALDKSHVYFAPFTWRIIRVICDDSFESIMMFKTMVERVKIPVTERCHKILWRLRYSAPTRDLQDWLKTINWEVAFQLEMMYREVLLDYREIVWLLLQPIKKNIAGQLGIPGTIQALRRLRMKLTESAIWESNKEVQALDVFSASVDEVRELRKFTFETGPNHFLCYHVTFTPTLMCLEGPFLDVSNRILRAYPEHQNHFLRVSFTDEEGLRLRFDRRDVHGSKFVADRVGSILKKGFDLCGRSYEFLSYSQSALKEYTVWFVSPFRRGKVTIDSNYIRESIGTRWSRELLRCPARYAARLSQAFTATDRGLIIEEDQIELIPDVENNGYCFTDGNGLVSVEMADAIYAAIKRQPTGHLRTPSVFQLRLQGAKGIITVDPTLHGLVLKLRPSMVKFASNHLEVEIARSFERPVRFFLNRPLTMILAGLGVPHAVFLKLQRLAVREAQEAVKSFEKTTSLFETHGLGTTFSLSAIFQRLRKLGVSFEKGHDMFIDPFMDRCLQYAVHHVLRNMKTKGRIPVSGCWKLVGTVDIYNYLGPGEIFVQIIREPGAKPEYLEGPILITKSPVIHPGDVQIVFAIGPPPNTSSYLGRLSNCVVVSQLGDRPLFNKLGGGDADGDEYDLIPLRELHSPRTVNPGLYTAAPRKRLTHSATIHDIADFVVDFINNDVVGIVATNFLLIADRESIFHPSCVILAELHSWAVDFPKNGEPVPFRKIPFPEISIKPDWFAPEVNTSRHKDYYKSTSILGVLFRDIELPHVDTHPTRGKFFDGRDNALVSLTDTLNNLSLSSLPLNDAVSRCLKTQLERFIDLAHAPEAATMVLDLFSHFSVELGQISHLCSLSIRFVKPLSEEEILIGTIIGKTSQPTVRQNKISSMREITSLLVKTTLEELKGGADSPVKDWVNRAWMAWKLSIMKRDTFGARCFGFVSIRALCDALNILDTGIDADDI